MKNNIICKIFGHKIIGLNVKRRFAKCGRCYKGLKVSYDMSYGETIVDVDYGNQKTFIWCECGNELCSTNSWLEYESKEIVEKIDVEVYKCSKCGEISKWDFGAPVPIRISGFCECKNALMGYTDKFGVNRCADCDLLEK